MKFCGHRVIVKDNHRSFNWADFTVTMMDYTPSGLYMQDSDQKNINQTEMDVSSMVDKIVSYLHDYYNILPDVSELRAVILTTFTDLKEANQSGWADFYKESSATNSSFEYRVVFTRPQPKTTDSFFGIVMTILLTADIVTESSWWGLESSTMQNFGAMITSMEIGIDKGFKDPGPGPIV